MRQHEKITEFLGLGFFRRVSFINPQTFHPGVTDPSGVSPGNEARPIDPGPAEDRSEGLEFRERILGQFVNADRGEFAAVIL